MLPLGLDLIYFMQTCAWWNNEFHTRMHEAIIQSHRFLNHWSCCSKLMVKPIFNIYLKFNIIITAFTKLLVIVLEYYELILSLSMCSIKCLTFSFRNPIFKQVSTFSTHFNISESPRLSPRSRMLLRPWRKTTITSSDTKYCISHLFELL